ncbi:MAG: DUF3313 family protein [Halioglobus sp.]
MAIKPLVALLASLALVGGCAELDALTSTTPEHARTAGAENLEPGADETYINYDAPAGYADYRNVYIAPANLANMQVIQPEGGSSDSEWWVTDSESGILQRAIATQFAAALGFGSAFYLVDSREQAQIIVNTAVVAVHPNETRATVAAGGKTGGAITVSIAVTDATSGKVLVRSVDTGSSDNIWAFNQVENDDPEIDRILRGWGDSIRRGLLQLQGRPDAGSPGQSLTVAP